MKNPVDNEDYYFNRSQDQNGSFFTCAPVTFSIKSDRPPPSQKSKKAQPSIGLLLDYYSFIKAKQSKTQPRSTPRRPMAPQAPQLPRVGRERARPAARHRPPQRPPCPRSGGAAASGAGRKGSGKAAEEGQEGSNTGPSVKATAARAPHGRSHAAASHAQQQLRGLR